MLTRFVLILASLFSVRAAMAGDLPQYKLHVGQELKFVAENQHDRLRGLSKDESITWTLWVVARERDGAWYLVIQRDCLARFTDPSMKGAKIELSALHFAQLYFDGRLRFEDGLELDEYFFTELRTIFPKLPTNEKEIRDGYEEIDDHFTERVKYRVAKRDGDRWQIEANFGGLASEIYVIDSKFTCNVDAAKGLPTEMKLQSEQRSRLKTKMTGTIRLDSVQERGEEWAVKIAREAREYFRIQDRAAKSTWDSTRNEKNMEEALSALKETRAKSKFEPFQKKLDANISSLQGEIDRQKENKSLIAKLLRKSIDWTVTDLDGKTVKQSDFKDKIILLDFWYRGCFWCVRSMPQINQVADHYKDKPVVLLGMNTDEDEDDARFVIKKMELRYPTLKAGKTPADYGVRAFPTLLILNEKGVVTDAFIGYDPNLKDVLIRKIDKLLAQRK
jgi:thiol-disulfide isomerase/thioredoxin